MVGYWTAGANGSDLDALCQEVYSVRDGCELARLPTAASQFEAGRLE